MRWTLFALGGLLAAAAAPARAQEVPADPANGLALAEQLCRNCHLVRPEQRGPVPDDVPSFMAVAGRPGVTQSRLEAALIHPPHPMMPNPPLSQQQIRDVAAYILSLKP
jgi:mono/diheme cytochrome c family protein